MRSGDVDQPHLRRVIDLLIHESGVRSEWFQVFSTGFFDESDLPRSGYVNPDVFQSGGSGPEVRTSMCPRVGTNRADLRQSPPSRKRLRHNGNHLRQLLLVCCHHGGKRTCPEASPDRTSLGQVQSIEKTRRQHSQVAQCSRVMSINLDPPRSDLRSSTSNTYVTPRLRTKFGERAFSHAGPTAWNSLSVNIRAETSQVKFKKLLKTHFLISFFSG